MSDQDRNLDRLAAQHAQRIIMRTKTLSPDDTLSSVQRAGDVDNTVTKALGVLQENGVYAFALYLLSRSQDKELKIARVVMDEALELLGRLGFAGWQKPVQDRPEVILQHLADKVTADKLERLLLAKETLEKMLIYARYGARARRAEERRS